MKTAISLLASMALSAAACAQPEDQLGQELQLKVSNAYSQCAAYYEISSAVREATNGVGVDDAKTMKQESVTMAISLAAEYAGKDKAREITDDGFARAIEDMYALIKSDPEAFREWAEKQRRSCRMAVNDPRAFVKRILAEQTGRQRKSPYIQLPKNLTVEDILKHGKPATEMPDITKCADFGVEVTIPLDDVLVDDGMVCPQHKRDVCSSERSWMSYSQYIQSLYPDREFGGHSQTLSITFKNGQRQEKRTLVACMLLPDTST